MDVIKKALSSILIFSFTLAFHAIQNGCTTKIDHNTSLNNHRLSAGGFGLRTESPDTRRLNDASFGQRKIVSP